MKHGLALLAAGLVLLLGAVLVACPLLDLVAGAGGCLARVAAVLDRAPECALWHAGGPEAVDGVPGIALIFLLGGLASLGSGIVALRVSCPPTHARWSGF